MNQEDLEESVSETVSSIRDELMEPPPRSNHLRFQEKSRTPEHTVVWSNRTIGCYAEYENMVVSRVGVLKNWSLFIQGNKKMSPVTQTYSERRDFCSGTKRQ